MAIPVFETDWVASNSGGTTVNNLTFTKPAGAAIGNLLIIMPGDDQDADNNWEWETPTDWNLAGFAGNGTSDAYVGFFWKKADGTEGSTLNITRGGVSDELYGWYGRVSGQDQTNPIHAFLATAGATGGTYTIDGVTTSIDDCLIIAAMAEDGADGGTFTINTGAGWAITDQEASGDDGNDAAGLFALRDQASLGGGVDLLIDSGVTDGKTGFQIAIAPASPDTDVTAITEELTLTPYQADIAIDIDIQANAEALTLTPYQATVAVDIDIQANAEALTLTPYQATITNNVVINANAEALTLTTYQADISVDADTDVQANTEALTLTTYQATITLDVDILANAEALTLTPYQATITLDVGIQANAEALTLTPYQATVAVDVAVLANTEALTLTPYQATIVNNVNIDTNVEALTLTTYQATISTTENTDVQANTEALTLTTYQATISAASDTDVQASAEILTLTTYQAEVSVDVEDEEPFIRGIGGWVRRYEWEEGERDKIERDDQRDLRRIVHEAFHGKSAKTVKGQPKSETEKTPDLDTQRDKAREAALEYAKLKGLALSIEALEALLDSYLAQLAKEAEEAEEDDIAILLLMMA